LQQDRETHLGTEDGGGFCFAASRLQAGCLNAVCSEEMYAKCRVQLT